MQHEYKHDHNRDRISWNKSHDRRVRRYIGGSKDGMERKTIPKYVISNDGSLIENEIKIYYRKRPSVNESSTEYVHPKSKTARGRRLGVVSKAAAGMFAAVMLSYASKHVGPYITQLANRPISAIAVDERTGRREKIDVYPDWDSGSIKTVGPDGNVDRIKFIR